MEHGLKKHTQKSICFHLLNRDNQCQKEKGRSIAVETPELTYLVKLLHTLYRHVVMEASLKRLSA